MSGKEGPGGRGGSVQSSESDRRSSERFSFSAIAEVMDRRSGARITVRIADIGKNGCYADSLNVFSVGTQVIMSIRHADVEFKTMATVVYAMPSMGMGLHFREVASEMRSILEKWISEARGEFSIPFSTDPLEGDAQAVQSPDRKVLHRLLELLVCKNLLTQEEGSELLEQLSHET